MGSTMGSDDEFRAVVSEFAKGRLSVPVDSVYPLDRARDAFVRLQSGEQFGKVVIRVSQDGP
jgi:zinc-binding alcohol dehydrogenase/oxidoreductase